MHAFSLTIEPPRIRLMPPPSDRRSPTEPSLHGVAAGIDDVLRRQDATHRGLHDLSESVGTLEAKVVHHGVEIRELKEAHHELVAVVGEQGERIVEHGEKLAEQTEKLEEVARIRHVPTGHRTAPGATLVAAAKTPSIPPLADIGERQPTGSFKVQAASWDILNDRIQKIETQAARDRSRAEGAEDALNLANDRFDRIIRIMGVAIAGAGVIGALIAWLVTHAHG